MSNDADDSFLGRWSKRKLAVRRGETPAEPARAEAAPPAPPPPAAAPSAPPELPPVDSLKGLASDYQDFLRPDVDPATKSAALRKLFGDPHFNRMDGLDIYIDDYTREDPIPPAMLRVMNQARSLGLFDDEEKAQEQEQEQEQAQAQAAADTAPAPAVVASVEGPAPAASELPLPSADAELQPVAPAKPDPA